MVTLTMAGVVVRRDGRLLTVLGTTDRDGEMVLHIQGAAVDFWVFVICCICCPGLHPLKDRLRYSLTIPML